MSSFFKPLTNCYTVCVSTSHFLLIRFSEGIPASKARPPSPRAVTPLARDLEGVTLSATSDSNFDDRVQGQDADDGASSESVQFPIL